MKKVVIVELNEFNEDLARLMAERHDLKNLKKIFSMKHARTQTDDSDDNDTLDPWVQWVSIHTGVPYAKHRIKRLGDVPDLSQPVIWKTLSDKGITSGVWGVLNGEREGENCRFFLPDPWTYSEPGFPAELGSVVGLPRYMAKHRVGYSVVKVLAELWKFLVFLLSFPKICFKGIAILPAIFSAIVRKPLPYAFFVPVEYLSTMLFCEYQKRYGTNFNILFLNSIAHLQHYFWYHKDGSGSFPFSFGFKLVDKMIGEVFSILESDDVFLVLNGFSQVNTNDEPTWCGYRPIDHDKYLDFLGLSFLEVEELMTYDAQVLFSSEEDLVHAEKVLSSQKLDGENVFYCERNPVDPHKMFYRVCVHKLVSSHAFVEGPGGKYDFHRHFSFLGSRTGRHSAAGVVFYKNIQLPETMMNHELKGYLENSFQWKNAA
ncbi:MAG: hypothetical protein A4S09_00330 [Proteobacteria bacterium SG_bin7]|nr:MAG: hypothetical protein A4S09_00330 [Proteobacteria bacterium SG_bin7]